MGGVRFAPVDHSIGGCSSTTSPQRTQRTQRNSLIDPNGVSGEIVDGAMQVHSATGPGLLESTYQACLACELRERGLTVRTQVAVPIVYKGIRLEQGYRIDILV